MVKVMNEAGIDVSGQESKGVDGYLSARLMGAIFAREYGLLCLMCNEKGVHYYEQFGFKNVARTQRITFRFCQGISNSENHYGGDFLVYC
jgi:hypothetical protein